MEREFYTDEFEQLIKEKSDQFRMYPSKRVWHSIYNNLHPSRRWPSFAISILFLTSLLTVGYLNTSDNAGKKGLVRGTAYSGMANEKINPPSTGRILAQTTQNDPGTTSASFPEDGNDANSSASQLQSGNIIAGSSTAKNVDPGISAPGKNQNIIQAVTDYLYSNQLFRDADAINQKNRSKTTVAGTEKEAGEQRGEESSNIAQEGSTPGISVNPLKTGLIDGDGEKTASAETINKPSPVAVVNESMPADLNQEKAWIENFVMHNKPARSRWKDRLDFVFYATPAVNYRKLTTESKGSSAPFATTGDINKAISQKPGLGIETGIGVSYAFAKSLRLKAGFQFNYTNYNISADQTSHPIQTSILLTDPVTGYSYPAPRTSSIANSYGNSALQPVTLHNRTYQVSIPIGLAYKLSSNKNVEWFVGAAAQPSYIFGGKAHLISSDLKNYVSDPSSIRNWNLNIGIETYMTYKLGSYSLQVGPQVRYQVYSTYRKDIALIEKPYAVGLKLGIVKGF